jgi:hypothetical protein
MMPEIDEERCARVRQFLLDELAGRFRSRPGRSSRWLGWLLGSPSRTWHVFEHDGCDPDRDHCRGEIRAAWLIGPEGVQILEMAADPAPDRPGTGGFVFPRYDFHIARAGDWIIQGWLNHPRAGYGGRYRVVPKGAGFRLVGEGSHWKA